MNYGHIWGCKFAFVILIFVQKYRNCDCGRAEMLNVSPPSTTAICQSTLLRDLLLYSSNRASKSNSDALISDLRKLKFCFSNYYGANQLIWSSMRASSSYSRENYPVWNSISDSNSNHANMWGVNHAIFGIIRNAISYSITEWNMTIFDGLILCHTISSKRVFIYALFYKTQPARVNCYYWSPPPPLAEKQFRIPFVLRPSRRQKRHYSIIN